MCQRDVVPVYCTIMRCGTSKGIFLNENDLPSDPELRDKIIRAIFGSPDPRQIDGIAGADLLTSKLALISASSRPDADVDFSFGQVDICKPAIYYDGLCGNIASGVGTYAIEEGLVRAVEPITKVRVHSRNTNQVYIAEVQVKNGKPIIEGDYQIAGVPGTGAKIDIDMAGTVGARTGKLLPTGNVVDILEIPGFGKVEASMLDLVNPCIFVRAADIGMRGDESPSEVDNDPEFMLMIDKIRVKAVEKMGITDWHVSNPIPFVAFVSPPKDYTDHLTGKIVSASKVDFLARMIWLSKMHQAYAGSVSCVTGIAAVIPGTIVYEAAKRAENGTIVRIGHPAGVMEVEAEAEVTPSGIKAKRVTYSRTARRLMDGNVYVPRSLYEQV